MVILDKIKKNGDIRKIKPEDYGALAEEIRHFLIQKISRTGGHLASNLGVVELTMALHLVFNFEKDKIVWDVGHQSYVHKILTGRKEQFDTLRQKDGLSGFPKRQESVTDCFDTGHSSASVSAGMGFAAARDLAGEDYSVISVIGDGAATGGMFYEALNNAGRMKSNFIIVLNDNEMSIAPNLSGMACYLSGLRTASSYNDLKEKVKSRIGKMPRVGDPLVRSIRQMKEGIKQLLIPEMLFENFGVTYLGPVDGHNIQQMAQIFREAKRMKKAVLVHVVTKKGKGYSFAEKHPDKYHGVSPFDVETGEPLEKSSRPTWTSVFSSVILEEAKSYPNLVAITAAMPDGTGLKKFGMRYPKRFFDVGIAEEHAVTFAAGLAAGGQIPVVAVYSSFLQRSYDQILQDVCLQNLHVIFAVDRAGLVGQDGSTHQGIFDAAYLAQMPNMTVLAPRDAEELKLALKYAIEDAKGPIAVRYGRGAVPEFRAEMQPAAIENGKAEILTEGKDASIIAVGNLVAEAEKACLLLKNKGLSVGLVNARFLKPMDTEMLEKLSAAGPIAFLEEDEATGGYGERASAYLAEHCPGCRVKTFAIADQFVEQGTPEELRKDLGLDAESVAEKIERWLDTDRPDCF